MQRLINSLSAWSRKFGLEFCPDKTVVVLFTRKHFKKEDLPVLTMNGRILEVKDEVKYLGITLDKRLTFTPHINNKI